MLYITAHGAAITWFADTSTTSDGCGDVRFTLVPCVFRWAHVIVIAAVVGDIRRLAARCVGTCDVGQFQAVPSYVGADFGQTTVDVGLSRGRVQQPCAILKVMLFLFKVGRCTVKLGYTISIRVTMSGFSSK